MKALLPKVPRAGRTALGLAVLLALAAAGPALAGLIADPHTLKILHDARQDLALLAAVTGAAPHSIFDTRLAAGFAGLGGLGLAGLRAFPFGGQNVREPGFPLIGGGG